jgi:hypothetical protein
MKDGFKKSEWKYLAVAAVLLIVVGTVGFICVGTAGIASADQIQGDDATSATLAYGAGMFVSQAKGDDEATDGDVAYGGYACASGQEDDAEQQDRDNDDGWTLYGTDGVYGGYRRSTGD